MDLSKLFPPGGSSPLARGTYRRRARNRTDRRLIPARAGNIDGAIAEPSRDTAHPRSRGEHGRLSDEVSPIHGSSPLARGTFCAFLL